MIAQEKETIQKIKESNSNRSNTRSLIQDYKERLTNLQDQKRFLLDYLRLYESSQQKIAKEFAGLFDTRADLHKNIDITLSNIEKNDHENLSFDFDQKMKELQDTKAFALRDEKAAPLSWPLYPVEKIDRFFGDRDYEEKYGIPYYGIQIPAAQQTPLFASDEALVYKIANKE